MVWGVGLVVVVMVMVVVGSHAPSPGMPVVGARMHGASCGRGVRVWVSVAAYAAACRRPLASVPVPAQPFSKSSSQRPRRASRAGMLARGPNLLSPTPLPSSPSPPPPLFCRHLRVAGWGVTFH